ncbi:MAG: hypothetical protein JWL77_1445 [Chthonomonadaceae bacterium]|nr:hypothetical protein [Chthonomonadaceae bacterium]
MSYHEVLSLLPEYVVAIATVLALRKKQSKEQKSPKKESVRHSSLTVNGKKRS